MTDFLNPITGGTEADITQVFQLGAVALGNGSNMFVRGQQSALLNVSGITTATIIIEGTSDNINWAVISVSNVATGVSANSITANGLFSLNFLGLLNIRARISGYTSGTINVSGAVISFKGSSASGGGGGASSIADGADVAEGAIADAAVITDVPGTLSSKLRGIVKLLAAKLGITAADGDISTLGTTTGAAVSTDAVGTVQQYLRGLVKLLAQGIGVTGTFWQTTQPVSLAAAPALVASEAHIGEIGGKTLLASVEIIRGTSTTAYAANQTVLNAAGTLSEITGVARINQGTGYITGIRVTTNAKSLTPRFRLHFFNASNPTFAADYASWKDLYADISKRIGYYDLPAMVTAADATNSDCSRTLDFTMRIPFNCAAATTSLFVGIETLDAFTPTNGQKITIVLNSELN